MYTISPVYACFVLREIQHHGLSTEALLAGASLSLEELQAGSNITLENFVQLLENARALLGDEQLGVHIGRHTNVAALGPIGAAIATAPTLRDGLQIMENFSRLHASYIRVELRSNLKELSVRFRFLAELGTVERFHIETAFMFLQSYVEMVIGQELRDAQFHMGSPDTGDSGYYARHLHSPLSFDGDCASLELPRHWLDHKSPYFNAEIWNQAQLLLAQRMKESSGEPGFTYSQHLLALLRAFEPPLPDLASISERLHMSERTLNRRLRQEESSFREIKAQVLQSWARRYLAETDYTVEAIAALLGYQDTANFRRAFRRREACSPGEYRQRVQKTGSTDAQLP